MSSIIAITCSHDTQADRLHLSLGYVKAVAAAGGVPVLLPHTSDAAGIEAYLNLAAGLLLSGGVDLDPYFFGQEPRPGTGEITPERDAFELELVRRFLAADRPVLGICRGIQVLNVACDGDLYQDLSELNRPLVQHAQKAPKWYGGHRLEIEPDSRLAALYPNSAVRVNSFHHQAVKRVAAGFKVAARTFDGVIEAIESEEHFFAVGVQWHPEVMWPQDPSQLKLFQELVACCERQGRKTVSDAEI